MMSFSALCAEDLQPTDRSTGGQSQATKWRDEDQGNNNRSHSQAIGEIKSIPRAAAVVVALRADRGVCDRGSLVKASRRVSLMLEFGLLGLLASQWASGQKR